MNKLESTEMDIVVPETYKDESFYLDVSGVEDYKKSQEMEQDENGKMPILTQMGTSDPKVLPYKDMVEKIIEAGESGHEAILIYLNSINFGIGDSVQKEGKGKSVTIFRIILENVSNGHDLILHILDCLVKKIPKGKCTKCFDTKKDANIEIELQPMFRQLKKDPADPTNPDPTEISHSKMRLIRDLLDIQSKRGDDENIIQIFQHPVIKILILKKWENYQVVYIGKVRFFALIVFLFTFFVRLRLLEEDENRCIEAFNSTKNRNLTNMGDCVDFLVNSNDNTSDWVKNTDETTRPFSQLLIFKYKETSFTIFAVAMVLVAMIQIFCLTWVLLETMMLCKNCPKHKKRRMIQTIKVSSANMIYLSFAISLVCISSPIPTLKIYILLFWICILLAEIHQVCFLVCRPAWQGFNHKCLKPILQHRYFKDPENYLELFCLVSIPLALNSDAWARIRNPLEEHDANELKEEAVYRGVVAIGVFAAWTELFIKLGNVSHSVVGDFTKMFYNIIKTKLLAYMQVCVLLIVAFSLAFWIILEGHLKEDGVDFSKGFWVNLVLTVTMSTGEFNTGDFYKNIDDNEVIKAFAMFFLIGLVILSTITMINLLVAAIISDYEKMKVSVDMENLFFITEYIIEVGEHEKLLYQMCENRPLAMKIFNVLVKKDDEKTLKYCPHLICNSDVCDIDPLPIAKPGWSYDLALEAGERKPLLLRLLEIRKGMEKNKKDEEKEKEEQEGNLCPYHKYGWQLSVNGDLITCSVHDDKRTPLKMKTNSTESDSSTPSAM